MQPISDTYTALRVTIEAKLAHPALLVVSSARREDGSADVACNLARAFADSSYRTILIDTNVGDPCLAPFTGKTKVEPAKDIQQVLSGATNGVVSNLSVVSMATHDIGAFNSGEKMDNLISVLKEKYDVIVVQTAPITTTPLGMQFAHIAEGVLMAVKFGRKPSNDDKQAITQLERIGATVLGVVITGDPTVETVQAPVTSHAVPTLRPSTITGSDKKESIGAAR